MRRTITVGVGFVILVLLPRFAPGQTVYSDGLNHDVSGASQAIEAQNDGTSLTVLLGAAINGVAGFDAGAAVTGGVELPRLTCSVGMSAELLEITFSVPESLLRGSRSGVRSRLLAGLRLVGAIQRRLVQGMV